ncbi:MAG TPA: bifunctional phosphopantothenoylcysteine decarboxylase/phosphopantothenate synthase [Solirubrobacteraceae bacterium]|nr:bifunctional phosphopantothenoylcysteine decarboxylase/phosphopantothenate synthase [Solirubrobacteraceae bacterium]
MARILLGVSGGIAAYKALEFVRLATAAGHAVRVVQTPTSRRFVGEASFAALSGAPALISEFERDPARGAFPGDRQPAHDPLSHLELVRNAELYLIAPATANTIAKLANGFAEDLLSSCALAATCPVLVAPAMNNHMYEHAATRANVQALRDRGVTIVEPESGRLASKDERGIGRLAEPQRLLAACEAALATHAGPRVADAAQAELSAPMSNGAGATGPHAGGRRDWSGLRVLVSAGGTREPIDSVRYLGNSSSGRMGLALAEAALARGADVTLVAANVSLLSSDAIARRDVGTAAELRDACQEAFPDCDVLFMAAAVADFRPVAPSEGKIKKSGRASLALELEPTDDVLAALAARRRADQTLVGFAAEHGANTLDLARRKLVDKGVDAIVANDISRSDIGFDVDVNEVTILTAHSSGKEAVNVGRAAKSQVAEAILDAVANLRR